MNIFREHLKLYLVTDRRWNSEGILEDVKTALDHGVTCLQIREKDMEHDDFLKISREMKKLTDERKIPFIINDDVEIAVKCDAAGVHIGQGDMPVTEARKKIGQDRILGVSVSTVEEALKAEAEGADYLGVGAMFITSTKGDANPVKLQELKAITETVSIPVVAIGGIDESNILKLDRTGVYGVAVVSSILAKGDIAAATVDMAEKSDILVHDTVRKVLTIAGSDPSGGAGIQADLKTMAAHNCFGMSVITGLTAQNTTGVYGIENVSEDFVANQMDCVFKDIRPEAVKVGMVSSVGIINAISEGLKAHKATHVVVDPVMVSTSGSRLLEDGAMLALKEKLIPLAEVITPNIFEAELLADMKIETKDDMVMAAEKISSWYGGHILVKGGHLHEEASDLLYSRGETFWYKSERIENPNTHGTGCTLSSAIASNLAKGYDIRKSIENSKGFITGAIKDKLNLGKGRGPLNHQFKS
ncbi:hydroxymethylpyrimidine kinase / phosphomethylpyrimidine kinase / thiamine-phosphate diphosphorylase [Dethiosulfatibacter aminovorans DSM 17477]|uniref:Thiamine-phosphate synthase n=1 Tax=Dethiosulfatibacter aminovorans DSM 17477 TaxID=1121476 RepID=A0A1M6GNR4_9FIRM|nr:bifunctional hydroxymethylpyrimidine kinase/phosphomethylpyrimidine kinase [Dethiosulfatibacter aminovorans]SHJ11510.1 hydroxymethylpyrimidine kinase / phosphomethylpyrimidine kinase / thiamine-phosphate diphosphorylase [Dethiosulfatibacter aminovorans DSM 17477]